jgi:hypothetical protein
MVNSTLGDRVTHPSDAEVLACEYGALELGRRVVVVARPLGDYGVRVIGCARAAPWR